MLEQSVVFICDAHCVVVAVLCTCVENGALGGPMSLCLNSDLWTSWHPGHQCQCWNVCCSFRQGFCLSFAREFDHCVLINIEGRGSGDVGQDCEVCTFALALAKPM